MNEMIVAKSGIRHSAEPATTSKTGESSAAAKVVDGGKQALQALQPALKELDVDQQQESVARNKLETAVAQMNEYIQSTQRDLHFNVDETSGHVVVRVLERSTGDLIRQIPNEDFLQLARAAKDDGNVNLIATSS